jgi:RimJ/RimL family protein N-acetyltransferase
MAQLKRFLPWQHTKIAYDIMQTCDALAPLVSFEAFSNAIQTNHGWMVMNDEEYIGYLTISDIILFHDACLHMTVKEEYRRNWCGEKMLKEIFDYVFNDLGCRRLTVNVFKGLHDVAMIFCERLGFQFEGVTRQGVCFPDGSVFDVVHYGMLREECKWL